MTAMIIKNTAHLPASDKGTRIALIYALVAESLTVYYEHGQWPTVAQGATLCAEWLGRSRRSLPMGERQQLSALAGQLARQIATSLSRQAGLFTAHELTESLDSSYQSEVGQTIMAQCASLLDAT